MFGKKAKEILELKAKLKEAKFLTQFWKETAAARLKEILSLTEDGIRLTGDNIRLKNELSELQSKLEKGEK